jgi:hypothetical protein
MNKVLCDIKESVRKMIHLNNKLKGNIYDYFENIMDCDNELDIKIRFNMFKQEKIDLKKELLDEIHNFDKLVNIYFETGDRWYNKVRISYEGEYQCLVLKVKRPFNIFRTIDDDKVKLLDDIISRVKFDEGLYIGELVYKPNLLDITL